VLKIVHSSRDRYSQSGYRVFSGQEFYKCVGCPDCYYCRCPHAWGDWRPDVHSAIYSMGAIRRVDPVRVERSESMGTTRYGKQPLRNVQISSAPTVTTCTSLTSRILPSAPNIYMYSRHEIKSRYQRRDQNRRLRKIIVFEIAEGNRVATLCWRNSIKPEWASRKLADLPISRPDDGSNNPLITIDVLFYV
jgi:hypothetical protein